MTSRTDPYRRPSPLLWRTELPRALAELAQFGAAFPMLALGPRGDGHAVLTIPGFLADDASLWPLRRLLGLRGYRAEGWGLGRNLGPTQPVLDGMSALLEGLHLQSGRRVSLVGSSLGGIYARELARRHPDLVRLVVTLGSPFQLDGREDNRRRAWTADMYQAMASTHDTEFAHRPPDRERSAIPVPATAIYTRADGVVPWRSCIEPDGPTTESVEVPGSHSGLANNVSAVAVILDRLAQPEGGWRPYRRRVWTRVAVGDPPAR